MRHQRINKSEKLALLALTLALVMSVKNCSENSKSNHLEFENVRLYDYGSQLEEENERLRSVIRLLEEKCSEL